MVDDELLFYYRPLGIEEVLIVIKRVSGRERLPLYRGLI
jgi:hypothetical protein